MVKTLSEIQAELKVALSRVTLVSDWDYWGVSPDSVSSKVGNVWPVSVTPGTVGKSASYEFLCTAALWSETEAGLSTVVSEFVDSVLSNFGDNVPCLQELASLGVSVSLGNLTVGLPSTSAASSVGVTTGIWSAVLFQVSIR